MSFPRLGFAAAAVLAAGVFASSASAQVLGLEVDLATGSGRFVSAPGTDPVSIIGYEIGSPSGQLTPAGWNSLQDQGIPGFFEGGSSSSNTLIEGSTGAGYVIPADGTSIGNIFSISAPPVTDLTFSYFPTDSTADDATPGVVTYREVPIPEPTTAGLFAFGGGLLLARRRRS